MTPVSSLVRPPAAPVLVALPGLRPLFSVAAVGRSVSDRPAEALSWDRPMMIRDALNRLLAAPAFGSPSGTCIRRRYSTSSHRAS